VFQSTLPRGERRQPDGRYDSVHDVSIHAPARGATDDIGDVLGAAMVSIHAPARGATLFLRFARRSRAVSIHAPARGATSFGAYRLIKDGFQSTLPRGERLKGVICLLSEAIVSIHAPARGATSSGWSWSPGSPCFNPRSRAGSDINAKLTKQPHFRFNPRSRAGSDSSGPGSTA